MNTSKTWELVERKMLELRILTNANWRNQEYELAVLGEKTLRTLETSKAWVESARVIMENLPSPSTATENVDIIEEMAEARTP